jgi:chemotaxis protein methyltransferase CheR
VEYNDLGKTPSVEYDSPTDIAGELYTLLTALIYRESGIKLGSHKRALLSSRLTKRMRVHGMDSFYDYYKLVKRDQDELIEMLNVVAVNTTKFFREPYHFEFLRDRLKDEILSCRSSDKTLRIWSAGCSTGEEPYSIALTLLEAMRTTGADPLFWDMKILASDISTKVLKVGATGAYDRDQLPDDISPSMVKRYFTKKEAADGGIMVRPVLREHIRFRRLNLKDADLPFTRKFDVIFCRNVMIYFDDPMQSHVLENFRRHLRLGGYLFLGHSEIMLQRQGFRPAFITVYQKTG